MLKDFAEIRRVATPWVLINTWDYRATIAKIVQFECETRLTKLREAYPDKTFKEPALLSWNCVKGIEACNESDETRAAFAVVGEDSENPVMTLDRARSLPKNTVLFFIATTQGLLEEPLVVQAMANLRDVFKQDEMRCLLVILGKNVRAHTFVQDDIPVLLDALPNDEEIQQKIIEVCETQRIEVPATVISQATQFCKGLPLFAIEEGVSRKVLRAENSIDLAGLGKLQQNMVEIATNKALKWETEKWNFSDIGGMDNFKKFAERVEGGPLSPSLYIRVDEVDKDVNASSMGTVADNTGTSQYILKLMLTYMNDKKWNGMLAVGAPGTGKTLASICTGNTFGKRVLSLDLGSLKTSKLGETERYTRNLFETIYVMAGERVMFMLTANRTDTLPPELMARFTLGTWFWDIPSAEEKQNIWRIQKEAFGIAEKGNPKDVDWVGRDIRNCCRTAYMLSCSLQEATNYITISGVANKESITRMQTDAKNKGYLSVSKPGPYTIPTKGKSVGPRASAN